MSELLGINIEKSDEKGQIIMTIRDIHPDANNVDSIYGFPTKPGEKVLDRAGFIIALLLEGADYYRGSIPGFIQEYERAKHLLRTGDLEGFDESKVYKFVSGDVATVDDDEIIETLLESSEIIERCPNNFWDKWKGEDYEVEQLPYARVKVTFKNAEWADKFDGLYFETAFDIHQDY